MGDKDTENEVLLLEHDIPHLDFSQEVLSCLPKLPWIIADEVSEPAFFIHLCLRRSNEPTVDLLYYDFRMKRGAST